MCLDMNTVFTFVCDIILNKCRIECKILCSHLFATLLSMNQVTSLINKAESDIRYTSNLQAKMDAVLMPNEIEFFVDTMKPQSLSNIGSKT